MLAAQHFVGGLIAGVIGPWQVVLVVVLILVLFGGKKLPELAKGLGRGLRLFKREMHGLQKDIEESPDGDEPQQIARKKADKDKDEGEEKPG